MQGWDGNGSAQGCSPLSERPALPVSRSHGLSRSGYPAAVRVLGPARKAVWLRGEERGAVRGPGGLQKAAGHRSRG